MSIEIWKQRELLRRVAALETSSHKPVEAPHRKGFWDVVTLLMPLVNGIALALVGWWLTGAVELALKRDQLQLAQVKEMQQLISSLTAAKIDSASALPAALTLAAYGKPAVAPLLALLTERFDEVRGPATEAALRAIGMADHDAVCAPLKTLMTSRTGRLGWPVHATVIRLLGDVQCREAAPQLEAMEQRLSTLEVPQLAVDFSLSPLFDKASVKELRKALSDSLRSLKAAS
jgi:hypothetical protein